MISSASEDKEQQKYFYSVDGNIDQYNHSENFVHVLVKINV